MGWSVGTVQTVIVARGYPEGPGFTVQQDGQSPAMTLQFENEDKANEARELMERALALAVAVVGEV